MGVANYLQSSNRVKTSWWIQTGRIDEIRRPVVGILVRIGAGAQPQGILAGPDAVGGKVPATAE